MTNHLLYLTGFPHAGLTLLRQCLSAHPDLDVSGQTSPLCDMVAMLRHQLSDSPAFLALLAADYDRAHGQVLGAARGLMAGWYADRDRPWVVDEHPHWLEHLELLHLLDPEVRMLVCVRELGQVYGAIESQHRQTQMVDFAEHLAGLSREQRALRLFDATGAIGRPLRAIEALQDIDTQLQQRLHYVVYEHLTTDPNDVLAGITTWLGLSPVANTPEALPTLAETRSGDLRGKYTESPSDRLVPAPEHIIPARIQAEIQRQAAWFYRAFYPGMIVTSP